MTYVPPASTLCGVPFEVASKFGMPHLGAHYFGDSVNRYRKDEGAVCAVCGKPAENVHHEPPKGAGGKYRQFTMWSKWGRFILKPALIAMCGSGTTGCHGDRHGGRVSITWEWFDEADAERWWTGELLSHGYVPHDPKLYDLGQWRIEAGGRSLTRGASLKPKGAR